MTRMTYCQAGLLLLGLLCLSAPSFASLPAGVTGCSVSVSKADFNRCVLEGLAKLTPLLRQDVPELGLPALDPFSLARYTVQGNVESLSIKIRMSNLRVMDALTYSVKELSVDPEKLTVSMRIHMPSIRPSFNYEAEGKLLFLVLNSVGSCKAKFTDVNILVTGKGKEVTDANGIRRIAIQDFKMKFNIGGIHMNLESPPKYAFIAYAAQTLINSSPRLVLNIARPIIDENATNLTRLYADQAWASVTRDEVLLK